jgi:Lsr2 protein
MNLRTLEGGFVSVGEKLGQKLLKRGYTLISSESPVEDSNDEPQGDDTQDTEETVTPPSEAREERPDVSVVRAWAKENDVEVSAKGRVSADVYTKYAEAHKN